MKSKQPVKERLFQIRFRTPEELRLHTALRLFLAESGVKQQEWGMSLIRETLGEVSKKKRGRR